MTLPFVAKKTKFLGKASLNKLRLNKVTDFCGPTFQNKVEM